MTPYTFAKDWVKSRFISFTIEDLKQAYTTKGGKTTGNGSEWGQTLQQLQKAGLIFKHPLQPFTTVKRPNGKPKVINVWISREFKEKQAKNATKNETLKMEL